MLLDLLTKPLTYLYYLHTERLEKKLGYKLLLPNNKNWIEGIMIFNMTPVWRKFGIEATGINYFIIGAINDGVSSRYDYNSPYYQAWLGGYVVKFKKNRKWSAADHFHLGTADQKQWLSVYGDPNPFVKFDKILSTKTVTIGGFKGNMYEANGWSNSDVGDCKKSLSFPIMLSGFANIFMISNPKLHLSYKNFIPKTDNNLQPYQKIYLKGFVFITDLGNNVKAVLYVNGAEFKDKNGEIHDSFRNIKRELLDLISGIQIAKV